MTRHYFRLFGLIAILFAGVTTAQAQCVPRVNFYWGEIVPNNGCGTWTTVASYSPGEYFRMPVLAGGSYSISTCGSSIDTQITGFEGTTTATSIFYNDDLGPHCATTQASIDITPNFTDYTRVAVQEYNCQAGGSSSITVQVRQNNNLTFTSSNAGLCSGDSLQLTATPAAVTTTPQPGSGNTGSFSGSGVLGTMFYAVPPVFGSDTTYTVTYSFGYCSETQDITVYSAPSAANGGADQIVCGSTTTLGATVPNIGTGMWSVLSGPGSVTTPSDAASGVTGLTTTTPTVLLWTITNGPCTGVPDTVTIDYFSVDTGVSDVSGDLTAYTSTASYQWLDCDNGYTPVAGATGQSFTASDYGLTTGNFAVEITENGCVDTSACFAVDFTSVHEIAANNIEISIYPNPSDGQFNVELSVVENQELELKITDLLGRIVLSEKLESFSGTHVEKIDISQEVGGVYIISVHGENGVLLTKRILKE